MATFRNTRHLASSTRSSEKVRDGALYMHHEMTPRKAARQSLHGIISGLAFYFIPNLLWRLWLGI